MRDITPKAPPGTLWKTPKTMEAKQNRLRAIGKVGRERIRDRRRKSQEPTQHNGTRQCYICLSYVFVWVLEHVLDASTHPELRSDPRNHRWACIACNIDKKQGTLDPIRRKRVDRAIKEVQQ